MIINHNMSAMFSQRETGLTNLRLTKNMEKLSSGLKINRAGDDAAGLAVSEKMRSQIRGLNQANLNAQNGISFIQATEGYLQETTGYSSASPGAVRFSPRMVFIAMRIVCRSR